MDFVASIMFVTNHRQAFLNTSKTLFLLSGTFTFFKTEFQQNVYRASLNLNTVYFHTDKL
jgi:hypothetical protein